MLNNPTAFPLHPGISPDWSQSTGMTLRDWFAGQIAAAYCTATDSTGMWMTQVDATGARIIAERAYAIADAMLAERITEKRNAPNT